MNNMQLKLLIGREATEFHKLADGIWQNFTWKTCPWDWYFPANFCLAI